MQWCLCSPRPNALPCSPVIRAAQNSPTISTPPDRQTPQVVCPVHFVMTLHVSMSHNLTAPSELPLTNFFPYGDNAMVHTQLSPSRQSFLICFPLSKFHIRSVPSNEQVIIRCPSGRCMVVQIELVCPSNFWRGVIAGVSFVLVLGEAMLQNLNCGVQHHFSFHPSHFRIITYEDNDGRWTAGHNDNGRFCKVRVESFIS
jgi:hypothetical protein